MQLQVCMLYFGLPSESCPSSSKEIAVMYRWMACMCEVGVKVRRVIKDTQEPSRALHSAQMHIHFPAARYLCSCLFLAVMGGGGEGGTKGVSELHCNNNSFEFHADTSRSHCCLNSRNSADCSSLPLKSFSSSQSMFKEAVISMCFVWRGEMCKSRTSTMWGYGMNQ